MSFSGHTGKNHIPSPVSQGVTVHVEVDRVFNRNNELVRAEWSITGESGGPQRGPGRSPSLSHLPPRSLISIAEPLARNPLLLWKEVLGLCSRSFSKVKNKLHGIY